MAEQDLFECEPLKARISARQCLFNVARASALKEYYHALGLLRHCLGCKVWRQIKVSLPMNEVGAVNDGI